MIDVCVEINSVDIAIVMKYWRVSELQKRKEIPNLPWQVCEFVSISTSLISIPTVRLKLLLSI